MRGAGQQTRGRWIAPNGRDYPTSSGVDSRSELVNEQLTAVINNTPCLRHEVACVKWISQMEVR